MVTLWPRMRSASRSGRGLSSEALISLSVLKDSLQLKDSSSRSVALKASVLMRKGCGMDVCGARGDSPG